MTKKAITKKAVLQAKKNIRERLRCNDLAAVACMSAELFKLKYNLENSSKTMVMEGPSSILDGYSVKLEFELKKNEGAE